MRLFKWEIQDEIVESSLLTILRLPSLVSLDAFYKYMFNGETSAFLPSEVLWLPSTVALFPTFFGVVSASALALLAVLFMLLPLGILVMVYMHILSGLLILLCELLSRHYVQEELDAFHRDAPSLEAEGDLPHYLRRQAVQFSCYLAISAVISWCLDLKKPLLKWLPMLYTIPMVVRIDLSLQILSSENILIISHDAIAVCVYLGFGFYFISTFPGIVDYVSAVVSLGNLIIQANGLTAIVSLINHLTDQKLFVLFWFFLLFEKVWLEHFKLHQRDWAIDPEDWFLFGLVVTSEICQTPLSLVASCLLVMMLSRYVITLVWAYLMSCKSHAPPSATVQSGITEGTIMFMLSLQTGLIDMEMPLRLGAISVILYIVIASLFQTILEITHPILLALSANSNRKWSHVKVLLLCAVIFTVPAYMSFLLVDAVQLDLWTTVVVSSSLLTSIQVVGHVIHYALYLYDSKRQEPMESLDDFIYYLKAFIASMELISALFVICAGLQESWNGNWSLLNLVILSLHFYFNVWLRIRRGWSSFNARRMAAARVQTLVDATPDQLRTLNDVCAICYSDMDLGAKITPCGHFFHGHCLKKWLFVQDHCPLCNFNVVAESSPANEQSNNPVADHVDELIDFDDDLQNG